MCRLHGVPVGVVHPKTLPRSLFTKTAFGAAEECASHAGFLQWHLLPNTGLVSKSSERGNATPMLVAARYVMERALYEMSSVSLSNLLGFNSTVWDLPLAIPISLFIGPSCDEELKGRHILYANRLCETIKSGVNLGLSVALPCPMDFRTIDSHIDASLPRTWR